MDVRALKHLLAAGGLMALLTMSGCATIINGTTQEVSVTSEPSGATVTTGSLKVTTPSTLELKRKHTHLLTFSKEKYQTETVKLEPVLSGAVAGNILAGGLIGWGVDAASGADSRLVPESAHVVLKPGTTLKSEVPETDNESLKVTEQKLAEADRLHKEGKVTREEHKLLRERIIRGDARHAGQ